MIETVVVPLAKGIILAFLFAYAGWIISKKVHGLTIKMLQKYKVDEALTRFLGSLSQYVVLAIAVMAALDSIGVETSSLVALFATAGLAIGLALQGSLGNFASGVMLLFFRPFTIADVVTVGGYTGEVIEIGLFATTLHTPDNIKIIIPNSAITGASIVNLTVLGQRRGQIDIGVAYGENLEEVTALLIKAASATDLALETPAPAVAFVNFGASSLDFKVFAWAKPSDYLGMLNEVRHSIYNVLNEAEVEIPFNQIVIHQEKD